MKKILIVIQVLLVILAGSYIVYTVVKPKPILDYNPESWHSWEGFFVLSYPGVTNKAGKVYISQKQLKEQLQALKQAGYHTIAPEDAVAFLENNIPLPEKAVMLLFEGGRKDSFLYSTPIIQNLGMIATMCVPTGFTNTWGSFYLKESDLKRVSKLLNWRLCSMGDKAVNEIPVDSTGSNGHFLTRRMWLGKGLENKAVFEKRIMEDYAKAAHFLESVSGKKTYAYLYPFADPGTGANADPLAMEINRKAVATYHKVAFVSAGNPFNGSYDKPFSLNRLRVKNDWDGRHLIQEVENFMPRKSKAEGLSDVNWVNRGDVRPGRNALILHPGSSIWLRGSDYWSDLDITLKAHLTEKASLALFVRYGGADSYLRLTVTQSRLLFYEHTDTISQTLTHASIANGNSGFRLRLKVKGNRAWIWYNDKSVAAPIPLAPSIVRGRIGISCQNGEIQLSDFQAVPINSIFAFTDSSRGLPPSDLQQISALLPLLFSADVTPRITDQQRNDLLTAASLGVKTIPVIEEKKDMSADAAEIFLKAIISSLDRQSVKPLVKHFAVYGLDSKLPEILRKYGYRPVRILSPAEALRLVKERQLIDGDLILIKGYGEKMKETIDRLLHFVPPGRIIVQADSKIAPPSRVGTAINLVKKTEKRTE